MRYLFKLHMLHTSTMYSLDVGNILPRVRNTVNTTVRFDRSPKTLVFIFAVLTLDPDAHIFTVESRAQQKRHKILSIESIIRKVNKYVCTVYVSVQVLVQL